MTDHTPATGYDIGMGGEPVTVPITLATAATLGQLLAASRPGLDPRIESEVVAEAAMAMRDHGADYARGWIDGWWHVTGVHRATSTPTWRLIRVILGWPVGER